MANDFLGDYFTFDSKFFKSFIPLLAKPGFLTTEYNRGRRASYVLPLRLYFFTTIFFFFILTLHQNITKDDTAEQGVAFDFSQDKPDSDNEDDFSIDGVPADSLEEGLIKKFVLKARSLSERSNAKTLFTKEFLNQAPKVMILILPIFALLLKLMYIRRKIYYINHLIFSLHAHTIIFLYLLLAILIPGSYVPAFILIGIWIHIFFSMRRVYQQPLLLTALKLNGLLLIYTVPLIAGLTLLAVLAVVNA